MDAGPLPVPAWKTCRVVWEALTGPGMRPKKPVFAGQISMAMEEPVMKQDICYLGFPKTTEPALILIGEPLVFRVA